uniref:RNA binding motif protein 3 n=1 Tax=Lynx canadensis TaxID=61383 RepID=A0A667HUC4_LYNCA
MAPRTWCPAGVSGLFCPPALPILPLPLSCLTTNPSSLCLPTPSLWMVARSVWITRASRPGELEGVPLGPMGVVAATLEVVGTRAMGVADTTVDLEDMGMDMDMDMEGPETMVAEARAVMTATQEEITETIMTTEMRHVHLIYTRNKTSDPGSSFQMAVFIKIFGAALKNLFSTSTSIFELSSQGHHPDTQKFLRTCECPFL